MRRTRPPSPVQAALAVLGLALAGGGVHAVAGPADPAPAAAPAELGAAPGRRVALDFRVCSGVQQVAIRRIIGIEIGELLIGAGQRAPAEADHLLISCDGEQVRVEAGRWQRIERTFRMADFPGDAAPRALALAAIEALAALNPEVRERVLAPQGLATAPRAGPATAADKPAVQVTSVESPGEPAAPAPVSLSITVEGVRRTFLTQRGLSAWGGKVDLDRAISAHWSLGLDAEVASEQNPVAVGEASGLLTSAGAFVGLRGGGPALAGVLALGARIGFVRLSADPTPISGQLGLSVLRPWGGPTLTGRLLSGWGHLALNLSVETGLALFGAEGLSKEGATLVEASGAWVALSAGAGFRY